MARHPQLTLRTPQMTSFNRIKAFSKENVEHFFGNFLEILNKTSFNGMSIYNMDETGFSTVPTKAGLVISLKGVRRVGQAAAAERGSMITMALAVNAAGNSIPPFFLFPRKRMQATFMENSSPGSVGFANESGWMQQAEFVLFMQHFINHSKSSVELPVILFLDNHASHLSIEAIDLAVANGVHMLSFPPHCSHRMQPLDISVFGPLKSYYASQCKAWQKNNANRILEIRHIPKLVCDSLDLALTPKNIKSGFAATGIWPFNPDIFTDSRCKRILYYNMRLI
ncbi:hypothetical protein ALC62_10252 [Cyphomyrmex costatus]|uniref:DDE-1 domain-containing protein n=1 Tax=Cyphomyrmex costatus TaxID=456900 RepID=A0A151IEL7_9HYME|nr:hypothetical protein ALC62_10252 [Cyphomyrmex costatus]